MTHRARFSQISSDELYNQLSFHSPLIFPFLEDLVENLDIVSIVCGIGTLLFRIPDPAHTRRRAYSRCPKRGHNISLQTTNSLFTSPCVNSACLSVPDTQIPSHDDAYLSVTTTSKPSSCVSLASKEDLIVVTVVFAARQSQRRHCCVVELAADDPQTLIQVLLDPGVRFRNPDASCTAFRELFQRLVEVPIKLLFDLPLFRCRSAQSSSTATRRSPNTLTPAGSSRKPCHSPPCSSGPEHTQKKEEKKTKRSRDVFFHDTWAQS